MDDQLRELQRRYVHDPSPEAARQYATALGRRGHRVEALKVMVKLDPTWGLLDQYANAVTEETGSRLCGCENLLCGQKEGTTHVHPKSESDLGDYQTPGVCLNLVDPKVSVEYVRMCDVCAQELPEEYHSDGSEGPNFPRCECSKCAQGSLTPQEEIAQEMEPDPTEEGWQEWWEQDEWESPDPDDELWGWGRPDV